MYISFFRPKISLLSAAVFLLNLVTCQVFAQHTSDAQGGQTLLERVTKNEKGIDRADMSIQLATSGAAYFSDWSLDQTKFEAQRVRIELTGKFNDKFSYHYRQSLNQYRSTNVSLDKLEGTIEMAAVAWQMNSRWQLTLGKQATQLSGYEYWVNAIRVREYSDFNCTVPAYMAGVNMKYDISPTQSLNFQVVNNQLGSMEDQYAAGLPADIEKAKAPLLTTVNWDGKFLNEALQFRYSLSYGQQARKNNILYFTCGNVWNRKPILAYIDFMYSCEDLDSKGFLSTNLFDTEGNTQTLRNVDYFTTIAYFDYQVLPRLKFYTKGCFEMGRLRKSGDMHPAGVYRRSWNAQFCAEYYPLKEHDLTLYMHLNYRNTHFTHQARMRGAESVNNQKIALGLVYALPVF